MTRSSCPKLTFSFFFQAEDGIRDKLVTGVQTCALPIARPWRDPDLHRRRVDRGALLRRSPTEDVLTASIRGLPRRERAAALHAGRGRRPQAAARARADLPASRRAPPVAAIGHVRGRWHPRRRPADRDRTAEARAAAPRREVRRAPHGLVSILPALGVGDSPRRRERSGASARGRRTRRAQVPDRRGPGGGAGMISVVCPFYNEEAIIGAS